MLLMWFLLIPMPQHLRDCLEVVSQLAVSHVMICRDLHRAVMTCNLSRIHCLPLYSCPDKPCVSIVKRLHSRHVWLMMALQSACRQAPCTATVNASYYSILHRITSYYIVHRITCTEPVLYFLDLYFLQQFGMVQEQVDRQTRVSLPSLAALIYV